MTTLILSDWHAEEEGAVSVDVVREIVSDVRPSRVVLLGDTLGMPIVSRHPRRQTQMTLTDLRNFTQHLFDVALQAAPHAGFYWLLGNHEDRADVMYRQHAQQDPAWGMGCEGLLSQNQASRVHIRRYFDPPMLLDDGMLAFFHGADSHAAQRTLQAHSSQYVFQGHTHELYAHYHGNQCAVRCGHLGPVRPEYIKGPPPPKWTRGFVVVEKAGFKKYRIILEKL